TSSAAMWFCAGAGCASAASSRASSTLSNFASFNRLASIRARVLGIAPVADKRDLLILGGGLVGMALALTAARKGLSSHVVDRADPAEPNAAGFGGRASAISTASWNLFANIGIAERLEPHGCPIDSIAVSDGMKP